MNNQAFPNAKHDNIIFGGMLFGFLLGLLILSV